MQKYTAIVALVLFTQLCSAQSAGDRFNNLSKVVALGTDSRMYVRNASLGRWDKVQTQHTYKGMCYSGADNRYWGLTGDDRVWQTTNIKSQRFKNTSGRKVFITECGDGTVYGINKQGRWYSKKWGKNWTYHSYPNRVKNVTCNKQYVVAITSNNEIYYTRHTGRSIRSMSRISGTLVNASLDKNNNLWGVNRHGQVYLRQNNFWAQNWKRQSGICRNITAGGDGYVWCTTKSNDVYIREGAKGKWRKVNGQKMRLVLASHKTFSK